MRPVNYCKGECPVCEGKIEYTGEEDRDGDYIQFGWRCPDCGTEGTEWCTLYFDFNDVTATYEKEN